MKSFSEKLDTIKDPDDIAEIAESLNKAIALNYRRCRNIQLRNKQMFEKIKINPFQTIINGLETEQFVCDENSWYNSKIVSYCLALYYQNLIDLKYEPNNSFSVNYQQWKYTTFYGKIRYVRACTMVGQGTVNLFEVVDKLPYSKVLNINTMEIEDKGYPLGMDFDKLDRENKI